MTTSIVVRDVTKTFKQAQQKTVKKLSINASKGRTLARAFTALDDVSFTVEQGEAVGLMGLNGSGKSTLLKMLSGVSTPDSGEVLVRGRIAGLIEVGAGLDPDLTGRENIFLGGAILGMSREEIEQKYDAIVEFSEVEKFLGGEVRHYSSGQFMKLAFSIAVHTDCDVFLIDEVLAVGDQPFKKKCMRRIRELRDEGRTMFFVSHSPAQVKRLCTRGLVLVDGRLAFDGSAVDAVDFLNYDAGDDYDAADVRDIDGPGQRKGEARQG